MMNKKMSEVAIGAVMQDSRDEVVWKVVDKNSKSKTIMFEDGDGKTRSFALSTVNKHFEDLGLREVEDEESVPEVAEEVVETSKEVAEAPKKRERKTSRKSFEELVAIVPILKSGLQFIRMRNDSVSVKAGKARLFRLDYISDGYQLTADRKASVQILGSNKIQHLTGDEVTGLMSTIIKALA